MRRYFFILVLLFTAFLFVKAEKCSIQFANGDWRKCELVELCDSFVVIEKGYNLPPKKYSADKIIELIVLNDNKHYKVKDGRFIEVNGNINVTDEELKDVIKVSIPIDYPLKDKIILVNQTNYYIERAVVIDLLNPNIAIGSCRGVAPLEEIVMSDFPNNGLNGYCGHTLGLKVKGIRENGEESEVEYSFAASIHAHNHDLYITINNDSGNKGVLDF